MSVKTKVFGNLLVDVIKKERCVGCGACETSCPVKSITLENGTPKLVGLCISCGICYNSCPRTIFDEATIEEKIFGRKRTGEETDIGIIRSRYAVKTKQEDIEKSCQDGGAVTSTLTQFLSDGKRCAVVAAIDDKMLWMPKPFVAKNRVELIKAAGSKYTSCPILVGVDSAISGYKASEIAVVGTPCQIRALRKIETEQVSNSRISDAVNLKIGLFCMETFNYDDLIKFLESEGAEIPKITKFAINRGRFIAYQEGGKVLEVKLNKLKKLVRPCCEECKDFTSEFADISVGNVGSPDGWSTVLVRTERGEAALAAAREAGLIEVKRLEEAGGDIEDVLKLAKLKRKDKR